MQFIKASMIIETQINHEVQMKNIYLYATSLSIMFQQSLKKRILTYLFLRISNTNSVQFRRNNNQQIMKCDYLVNA